MNANTLYLNVSWVADVSCFCASVKRHLAFCADQSFFEQTKAFCLPATGLYSRYFIAIFWQLCVTAAGQEAEHLVESFTHSLCLHLRLSLSLSPSLCIPSITPGNTFLFQSDVDSTLETEPWSRCQINCLTEQRWITELLLSGSAAWKIINKLLQCYC